MEETAVVKRPLVRWRVVAKGLMITSPIWILLSYLLAQLLSMPIISCTDFYPDGSQVTHYGQQCLQLIASPAPII